MQRADSARTAMIVAAERLFAERGLDGVSLREIATAAGQRNNSAAQYHFGTKQGLVDAVFAHRMAPINVRRLELLAAIEARGEMGSIRALVEAFVQPFAEVQASSESPTWYARFLAQVLLAGGASAFRDEREVMTGLRRTVEAIGRCLGDLPPELRVERLELAGALVINALAQRERLGASARAAGRPPMSVLTADLVDATEAVLTAPMSAATHQQVRATRARTRTERRSA